MPWKWSNKKHQAAKMLAEGERIKKTAETVGIHEQTLYDWKLAPEFAARIRDLNSAWSAGIMQAGIAQRARRMAILQQLSDGQLEIVLARAMRNGHLTGGPSGLIVEQKKMLGYGETAQMIEEEVFDASLSREIRATLAQAAEEVGESVSKTEISGPGGKPLHLTVGVLDDIAERIKESRRKRESGDSEGEEGSGESPNS
jgi:transposase-like protein